jgi:hypothetical protein
MERRKFLRNGGIFASFFGAGAVAANELPAPVVQELKVKEDISHLAPPASARTFQINGSYEDEAKAPVSLQDSGGMYAFAPVNVPVTHSVTMTVGKDNRLWIKVGDEWHRVALES